MRKQQQAFNQISTLTFRSPEAIIVIMSDNARIDLERYEFKFIFLPRPDNSNRLVARIVALEDDKIVLKLESRWDGPTQFDAFWKFRRHVESEFDRILKAVPTVSAGLKGRTASGVSTGATASAASAAPSNRGVSGAPPAYSKN